MTADRIYAKSDRYVFAKQMSRMDTLHAVYVNGEHRGYMNMTDGKWGFYPFTDEPQFVTRTKQDCINEVAS